MADVPYVILQTKFKMLFSWAKRSTYNSPTCLLSHLAHFSNRLHGTEQEGQFRRVLSHLERAETPGTWALRTPAKDSSRRKKTDECPLRSKRSPITTGWMNAASFSASCQFPERKGLGPGRMSTGNGIIRRRIL